MSRSFTSDQVLIDRLLSNDTTAFEELYRRYWYSLYNYCWKKLHSTEEARRIVRDIFIEIWEKRDQWPANFSISTHLYSRVRFAVVESLNIRLNAEPGNESLQQEANVAFTVEALAPSRLPVSKKTYQVKEVKQIPEKRGVYIASYNPVSNVKWLFNLVSAKYKISRQ